MPSNKSKNKKERRYQRYLRNKKKDEDHKKEAWEQGKLIEPNHNNGPYPVDYSIELGSRLRSIMTGKKEYILLTDDDKNLTKNDRFIEEFRKYRLKIRDYLIHYNPEAPKNEDYMYLIELYETYQDSPEKIIEL